MTNFSLKHVFKTISNKKNLARNSTLNHYTCFWKWCVLKITWLLDTRHQMEAFQTLSSWTCKQEMNIDLNFNPADFQLFPVFA